MSSVRFFARSLATAAVSLAAILAVAPGTSLAAGGFGPLSGSGGCLVAPGQSSSDKGTSGCATGKALVGARAVAVSPDGANVYVVGGVAGANVAKSFGAIAILKRDQATGAISETGCMSTDGTDGRDGASGACTPEPSLLGASGVAVSRDGSTVYVSSGSSASVVAFSRDPATGALTRLGCFQATPRQGAPCAAANLFSSARGLVVSADGSALYVASPLEGAVSTLDSAASLRTSAGIVPAAGPPPAAATADAPANAGASSTNSTSTAGAGASGTSPSPSPRPLASIFSTSLAGTELLNPCIAANGLDGVCSVGTAIEELSALALSPDGKQVYGAATGSGAIDVFTPDASGVLSQTGCVMAAAPQGLCSSAHLLEHPFALAPSPDGKNVYAAAASSSTAQGRQLDVLTRNAGNGALTSAGCIEYQEPPPPPKNKEEEEVEQEEEEGEEAKHGHASAADSGCAGAAGLNTIGVVAVSGDGSSVYAIGSGAAAIFSRDPATGALSEASCAATDDSRCTSLPALAGVSGAAVSPDGRQVYVAASESGAVMAFGVGAAVTTARASASSAGLARVSVACPAGLHRTCRGRVDLTRALAQATRLHGHRRLLVRRQQAGRSGAFSIKPGRHATVAVRLTPSARQLLRGRRHLRLMAVVRAHPSSGGSGYGRRLSLLSRFGAPWRARPRRPRPSFTSLSARWPTPPPPASSQTASCSSTSRRRASGA
jgi:DNA-binding beta-propeller fold protein YncE